MRKTRKRLGERKDLKFILEWAKDQLKINHENKNDNKYP